jgi:protein TonB
MPSPPYSDEARKFKVNGNVWFEAVVNSAGRLENLRITRGLPGGLNETTLATAQNWRCNPALKDDKAVPTLVTFEINFRLY